MNLVITLLLKKSIIEKDMVVLVNILVVLVNIHFPFSVFAFLQVLFQQL